MGLPIKKFSDIKQYNTEVNEDQLTSIFNNICKLAKQENIKTNNLWLEPIPANIYVDGLRKKYKVVSEENEITAIIGEYDDPFNQKQGVLKINLLNKENIIIYGNAESGKETLLSTLIFDFITNYDSNKVQFYIMDFGSEALKIFRNDNHVGDVIFSDDEEKIDRFFEMIQKELKIRKSILSNYSGGYDEYISQKSNMPLFIVILNNYEAFDENENSKYEDIILSLTREGVNCGILFIITVSSGGALKYRLTQNFSKKIVLQLNSSDDYNVVFDNVRNKRPAHIFGRGLIAIEKGIYEFQTARVCDSKDYNIYIEKTIDKLNKENKVKSKPIKILPNVLKVSEVQSYLKGISNVPIGMVSADLSIYIYNFVQNFITFVCAKEINDCVKFVTNIFKLLESLKDIKIKIIDASDISKKNELSFEKLKNEIEAIKKLSEKEFVVYEIIEFDKFMTDGEIETNEFCDLLKSAKESKKCSFIIVDTANKLKNYVFSEWYSKYVDANTGIYIGKGIEDQTFIIPDYGNKDVKNNCPSSYGYVLKESEVVQIKLLGVKEREEFDE